MNCLVEQIDEQGWDAFVRSHPQGTFFHLWRWRDVLSRSFGHQPTYIAVERDGQLAGVLPLFQVRSLLFGKSAVTIPLGVYGGPIADSPEGEAMLLEKANEIARANGAKYLEIRGNPYGATEVAEGYKQKDLYVTLQTAIDPDPAENLARIPRKQRRMVRQGEKFGLKFIHDDARLRDWYNIYAASVRNLGTPVYPYSYFQNLAQVFGDQCKVFLVERESQTVAAVMSFFFKDQVLPYYGGALKEHFNCAPNDFMYWELMCYAAANGYRVFDFGRSKQGTGSYDFKRHWGFEPRPLPYRYHALNGHGIPDTSPLNPKFQWAIRIWRNLPLLVTKGLGPHIAKHIP